MVGVLSDWIKIRRNELGLSQSAAARASCTPTDNKGVHRLTWRSWELGGSIPEEFNFVRIEAALRWEAGSVAAILAGGEPTPLKKVKPILLDEVEEKLWAITDLPEPMRWKHIRAYRAEKALGTPPSTEGADQRRSGT